MLAAKYYEKAITILKEKYPRSLSVQNLRSSRASVLLELPDQQREALRVAQESIALDAMTYENYETLGEVYFKCEDFSKAIQTWKQAIERKNTTAAEIYDPRPYMELSKSYVALAQSRHGICIDDLQCREAVYYLEHALKCCTSEHVIERLQAYCALGYLHFTREDYDQAIKYLRLTQSFNFAPYTSTFYLAYAHLRKKEYDAALKQFRSLQKEIESLLDSNEILEADTGGHISLNEMKALALWGQAYIYAERDIYPANLLSIAERASALAQLVPTEQLQFPSRYKHCQGWILSKLDTLEPLEKSNGTVDAHSHTSNGEKAIEILLQAAELETLPEIYLHLAQACQNQLPHLRNTSEKQRLLSNIHAYWQHAHDLNGDYDKSLNLQLDDLLKSLPA